MFRYTIYLNGQIVYTNTDLSAVLTACSEYNHRPSAICEIVANGTALKLPIRSFANAATIGIEHKLQGQRLWENFIVNGATLANTNNSKNGKR